MPSYIDVKKQLEKFWFDYLKENQKNFSTLQLAGASPPSVFVGQYGYPKVNLGPMVPSLHGDTKSLDTPEMWIGKNLQDILNYRLSLVRGIKSNKVNDLNPRFILSLQELAMSSKSAECEMNFESKPRIGSDYFSLSDISLKMESPPFGAKGELRSFKLSSLNSDKRIENCFTDGDLKSTQAIIELYRKGIEVSQIQKILSLGMLGIKKNRKLVPTRWSISAVDDILSSNLTKEIRNYGTIDSFEVFKYNHFSNRYSILLIPHDVWSFEMIEAWYDNENKKFVLESDFEDANGLNHYPKIAGAYFAARLAVTEYLSRKKRIAAVVIFREIHPTYIVPLGVWQIREGIRESLRRDVPEKCKDFKSAIVCSCNGLQVPLIDWVKKSTFYRNYGKQVLISQFF
ncbi:MAG: hypothetical protein ACE5SW_07090 [Nitrososphaeraceae archaeon]